LTDALTLLGQFAGLVEEVYADEQDQPLLAESVTLVRANAAQAVGFGGAGKMVAVIDSGIDKSHPFLAGRVIEEACYSSSGHCPNGSTQQIGPGSGMPCPFAMCGHGTHVAGIVAGSGGGSFGVAPSTQLMALNGTSFSTNCGPNPSPCIAFSRSDQMAALERVFLLRVVYSFAAVNMSLVVDRPKQARVTAIRESP
jgi:subtilisin